MKSLALTPIRIIIIDDEELARDELSELLMEMGDVDILAKASNAIEGLKAIAEHKPDLVFLDIQMPQINGFEMLTMIDKDVMPHFVFVTAFDQYALQAFEDNAFDYLLKPVETCRLSKTLKRFRSFIDKPSIELEQIPAQQIESMQSLGLSPKKLSHIPCTGHNRILIIPVNEVESAFSDLAGVHIQTQNQLATSQLTLKVLEEKTDLIRCHRQCLVNLSKIREIKLLENGLAEILSQSGAKIPVSRRYLKSLKEAFGVN